MTNQVQKKSMPAFMVLTIICLIAALALAGTNAITKGPIQEHAMAAQREAFGAVMSADEYIEMTIPEGSGISALVEAKVNGETIGYCVVASAGGYAGPVAVTLGVDMDGKVTGAKIGDTSFAETSGFGSRWLAENQTEQFVGVDLKEGGAIEALSGATVTSTAVLDASNTALSAVGGILGIERTEPVLVFGVAEKKPVEQMALVGDIHEGSAKGFASDVKVQLTMDDAGAITGLAIESSGETAGFGTRCMEEPAFAEQFVGKTAPFAIGENIDALSGATVTSTAVVAAVNAAVEAPANPDAVPFGSQTAEEPAVEAAVTLTGDVLEGEAEGFQSEIKVQLTLDENGAIAQLVIDSDEETAGFGTRCGEDEAFAAQFIGKTIPVDGIDVLAGATVTSNAVIEAVNKAQLAEEAEAEVPAGTAYEAHAEGFQSDVKVTVYADEAGVITGVVIDSDEETAGFGTRCGEDEAFAAQFVGKTAPVSVDVLAGATVTSNAVMEAVNKALENVAPAAEEVVPATPAGTAYEAHAEGFQSDVKVTVYADEAGVITGVVIDSDEETAGFGTRCGEDEAFAAQFVGKTAPVTVDVLAGATVTSNAVMEAVNKALENVAPAAPVEEAVAPAGTAYEAHAEGFQSDVKVTVYADEAGVITGVVIDSDEETAGFGTRCGEDEAFAAQFVGKTAPVSVDVLAGATVTSNAVIEAVNKALENVAPAAEEAVPATPAGTAYEAHAEGFQSDVKVTVYADEAGVITGIVIDSDEETPNFGTRCGEDEAFAAQFVGKTAPVTVDVLAGATVTSNAVIEAVNKALENVAPAAEEAVPATPAGTAYEAHAEGFQSDVKVTVYADEAGVITGIVIDSDEETPNFGTRCGEDEAFAAQFVGKTAPVTVDVLAGATVTSNAVMEAVNKALENVAPAAPVEEAAAPAGTAYEAHAEGFQSDVKVTVYADEAGVITGVVIDSDEETPNFGTRCGEDEAFAAQFVGKTAPVSVDVLAGATVTSNAVIEAVNKALENVAPAAPVEEATPAGTAYEAHAEGFQSDVKVTVYADEAGVITGIVIDSDEETAGFGTRCGEDEAFAAQFVGKTAPVTVDVLAGATVTSNAVMEAVNKALAAE